MRFIVAYFAWCYLGGELLSMLLGDMFPEPSKEVEHEAAVEPE